jgi:hypothetical protein
MFHRLHQSIIKILKEKTYVTVCFYRNIIKFYKAAVFHTNWVTGNPFSFRIIKSQEENQERKWR